MTSSSPKNVLIVDQGSDTLKWGLSTAASPVVIPNCVARRGKSNGSWLVGNEVSSTTATHDLSFYRTCDRCCPTNWDIGRAVWLSSLAAGAGQPAPAATTTSAAQKPILPEETALLVTEPPFCPLASRKTSIQMYFEDFQFASVATKLSSSLALVHNIPRDRQRGSMWAGLVVDVGFGASFVVPHVVCGDNVVPVSTAIRRIDVGGKVLTNVLKEAVSFRHWNMMQEVALVQDIKEKACFVSQDFVRDMRNLASLPPKHYLLPDYSTSATGRILTDKDVIDWMNAHPEVNKSQQPMTDGEVDIGRCIRKMKAAGEQILSLGCEQFTVPEVLFNPSDVGINQYGIADAVEDAMKTFSSKVYDSESLTSASLTDALYSCILLRGGCSKLPGFCERMEMELRASAPSRCPFSVKSSDDPICDAWYGGKVLAANSEYFSAISVSKAKYSEYGIDYILRLLNPC